MKKYILFEHGGSENHGCEALIRTTAKVLDVEKKQLVLESIRPDEDYLYGIDKICSIVKRKSGKRPRISLAFVKAYLKLKIKGDYSRMDQLAEVAAVGAKRGDIAMSIGGDNYCYGDNKFLIEDDKKWKRSGLKTVLWGCSIEPELLEDETLQKDIKSFDLITARESISYEALKKVNKNTVLVADTAFLLEKSEVELPDESFANDSVGINMSPLIERKETIKGITKENYLNLIDYILERTQMKVFLIPHVVWKHDDDRIVLKEIYSRYEENNRVFLVDNCSCTKLKGYISKCRFFVGARTHATIAAYSLGIPTLVVGYSVKSKGIATDLFGTDENYVLPVQAFKKSNDLLTSFQWIVQNEDDIKKRLQKTLPEYIERINAGVDALKKL